MTSVILEEKFKEFIKPYELSIKKRLNQTTLQDREDLEQEILLKIYEKRKSIVLNENPLSFWDLIESKK